MTAQKREIDWLITIFIISMPLISLFILPVYLYFTGFEPIIWGIAFVGAILTNLTITTGYHRYFSHKSYEAHPLLEWLFLIAGAGAFQASAFKWGSDHRKHHLKVDTHEDPYNINEGFWYAHIKWMFFKHTPEMKARDLEKNPRVMFQHKYYVPLAIAVGFWLPTLIGYYFGSPVGGFLIGGVLRIAVTHQSTFFVNSLCHTLGKQTYSNKVSARDSWFVAILTHGEGYHNFHHTFQSDYRNGIRWYQWDPTKWMIQILKLVALAKELKMVPQNEIIKAKMAMDEFYMRRHGFSAEKLEALKKQIAQAQIQVKHLKAEYQKLKLEFSKNSSEKIEKIKHDLHLAQIELKYALKLWGTYAKAYANSI